MHKYLTHLLGRLGGIPYPCGQLDLFSWRGVLCTPLPFRVWGVPRVSLGVPCAPLFLGTLPLPRVLVARIQEDVSGSHLRYGVRLAVSHPPFSMGGVLALRHLHPLAAPLFHHAGILVGGLHSPPLCLLIIVGGLPCPSLLLGLWGGATAGSPSWPPILGGFDLLAILPSVSCCEVQDVSLLAAPPLTNVRALPPLMVDLRPDLIGSSWDVSGSAGFPTPAPAVSPSTVSTAPAPYAAVVHVSAPLSKILLVLHLFLLINITPHCR